MPERAARVSARRILGAFASALALLYCAGCGATTSRQTVSSGKASAASGLVAIGAGLYGPPRLQASVYAQGPPTTAAFALDRAGRLWLTAAGLESHAHDGVYVIDKSGAPAREVLAGLDNPLGLDWYAGKLYVSSVGRVDAYWGFDGTRFAEHETILKGPLAEAENNLLVTTRDGRLLMGVSATCDHCQPTSKWSGAIVSFRPDGSDLRLYAGRIRAPFGLAYFPGTSDLFVSMNQRDDLGAATPGDWLALVKEGESWGFPGCYGQGGSACAGVPRPIAELDKHAAVGGIAIATGQLGASVGTAALVTEWNVAKVQRVVLTHVGSTYRGAVTPFLSGIRNPLAIALTGDHSLLVGDWATGTIYRIVAR